MAKENETIADIIAEIRALSNPISDGIIAINGRIIADRIEAAHKRERAKIEADALSVGGMVEAAHKRELSKNMSKNGADFGQLGDAAKLRGAAEYAVVEVSHFIGCVGDLDDRLAGVVAKCRAALDAPPRNCDRFGTDNVEASLAYEEFCDRAEVEESVNGAIAWLLTLVAEKEGGAK